MQSLSRRSFLHKGGLTVGAVGAAAAMPSLGRLVRRGGTGAAAGRVAAGSGGAEALATDREGTRTEGPIMAHVRDLRRGEIDVFVGTRKVTLRDRATADLLYRATR
jgi:hypothetical protein